MITLEKAKEYLRVDGEEEDNLIKFLIEFSKEEIENSTGVNFSIGKTLKTYELAQLVIITDRFENRGSGDIEFKPNNILSSLYLKLKYGVAYEQSSKQTK